MLEDRIAGDEAAKRRQVLIEPRIRGLELDGAFERRHRLVRASDLAEQMTAVAMGLREIRGPVDGRVIAGERLLGTHQLLERLAPVVQGQRIVGIYRERRLVALQGFGVAAQAAQDDAAIAQARDVSGGQPQHLVIAGERLGQAARLHHRRRLPESRGGLVGAASGVHGHGFIRWPRMAPHHRAQAQEVYPASPQRKGAGLAARPETFQLLAGA